MSNKNEIQIVEASCDKCGVIGETLYHLHYNSNGIRVGSTYCWICAEERRDELAEYQKNQKAVCGMQPKIYLDSA